MEPKNALNDGARPSVLVIDDEQGLRDMMIFSLSDQGCRVVAAARGDEALALAARERFDAAVCDVTLPGISGLETLKALKALQPELKVVMMTGFADEESARQLTALGAFDYLLKPFQLEELQNMLARALAPGATGRP